MHLNISNKTLLDGIAKGNASSHGSFLFENALADPPSWDTFVQHVHNAAHRDPVHEIPYMTFHEKPINNLVLRNDFYMNSYITDKKDFLGLDMMLDSLGEVLADIGTVGSFVNVVGHDEVQPHCDNRMTLFLQCQGQTEWSIVDPDIKTIGFNGDGVREVYRLNPGDILYLGYQVWHSVKIKNPRAGIALGFHSKE